MNALRKRDARIENENELVVVDDKGNETRIKYEQKIIRLEKFDSVVVCMLDYVKKENKANVYAYEYNGKLAWRIEPANTPGDSDAPWIGLSQRPFVVVQDWHGITLVISPNTGKVIDRYLVK